MISEGRCVRQRAFLRCPSVVVLSLAGLVAAVPGQELRFKSGPEPQYTLISAGERPVLKYRFAGVPRKPYVEELYTPGGVQLLLDAPEDHKHHHGLMFALAVDGVDFWAEGQGCGGQMIRESKTQTLPRTNGVLLTEALDWGGGGRKSVLLEQRRIQVHGGDIAQTAEFTLVTWRSTLKLPESVAEAQLSGGHYFGLGLRFVRGMDKVGKFMNSDNADGEVVRGDETLYPGRWCAYTASVDGKPVTVAMFDGPNNIRPATWFTMADPFAYLSATLKLHKEPLTLKAGQSLQLTYGIAAWDGAIEPAQIEKVYRLWLGKLVTEKAAEPAEQEPKP